MTVAAMLEVPLSAYLGGAVGWRWALAGGALVTVLAFALVAALLPPLPPPSSPAPR